MAEPISTTIDVEVRYAETDQMGVVHHSRYLVWFELARTRLCAQTEYPYPRIEEMGYWLMVTGARLSYRGGARYGDVVQVRCWIDRMGSRVMHFGYEVTRRAGEASERLVNGTTEHVWVEAETMRLRRVPEEIEPVFSRLLGS